MKKYFFLFKSTVFFLLLSCNNKQDNDIKLTFISKELIAYGYGSKKDTINIVNYCLENKSNIKYYILNMGNEHVSHDYSYIDKYGVEFNIYNNISNKEVEYDQDIFPLFLMNNPFRTKCDSVANSVIAKTENLECKRLKYNDFHSFFKANKYRQNHFIHPGEKIYGRIYLNITDTMRFENGRSNYAKLFYGNKYYTKANIISDSANYKTKLPPEILKRIKDNDVKIYHGKIVSTNTLPIKVIR